MPFAAALTVFSLSPLSVADLVRIVLVLALAASLLMFFRPLLSGLLRALVLTVRPRRPRTLSAGA